MSILIKGMEMPKSCLDCKWLESWMHNNTPTSMDKIYIVPRYFCHILRKNIDLKKSSKADVCPLVEVKPHGRLIDADAFEYTCKFNYCNGCEDWNGLKCKTCWVDDMLGELENAPTIIESEGEK